MDKKLLREVYFKKRMDITFEKKQIWENEIYLWFKTLSFDFPINFFASYRAIQEKNEISISRIEKYLESRFHKAKKGYPKMIENNQLEIIEVNNQTTFIKNDWNIEEPANGISIDKKNLDIILTPLLIFDEKGFRVGYGKGMYDRLFSECKKNVLTIGFCLFSPIKKINDIHTYDIPLDIIITPQEIFRFKV